MTCDYVCRKSVNNDDSPDFAMIYGHWNSLLLGQAQTQTITPCQWVQMLITGRCI